MLGGEAFVGRLAFADDQGYEAYVEKALRCAAEPPADGARSLFYTVRDGTPATAQGYRHLVAPSVACAREGLRRGWFPAAQIHEIGGGDGMVTAEELAAMAHEMLREAERSRAGLLFSLGHGAGAPRRGWRSPEEQRAEQGALVLGRERLTARDLAARPFLPGGLWFLFACFGAGTPARSAYYHWLARLHEMGMTGPAARVLDALPRGAPPFVASLPQAALANPAGPLGVLGHVDLAWTWSFLDHGSPEAGAGPRRRAERFQGLLRALVQGHRFGPAHHEITRFFCSLSTELSTMYDEDAAPGGPQAGGDGPREAARAGLWMQRQDLGAYVLLGDPAARLPIARWPEGVRAPASGLAAPQAPARAPSLASVMGFDAAPQAPRARAQASGAGRPGKLAEAVLAVLRGGDERATALRYGIEAADLRRAVGVFLEAGRAALRKRA
ncbi:hypothetical protein [Sorangium sp. So ce341]|uniref:hypothetical protein n=1 Tax=Sorangium sp. So ce341 TaxID=3133302 RepID=UPI003F5F69E5